MHNRAQKGGDEELHQIRPWYDLGNALPVFWLYAQNLQCTWIRPWYNLGTTLERPEQGMDASNPFHWYGSKVGQESIIRTTVWQQSFQLVQTLELERGCV